VIQIRRFENVYPDMRGTHLRNWQAGLLAGSGRDHYLLCQRLHRDFRQSIAGSVPSPSFFVFVTLMQQTLEFLLKALACRCVPAYKPKQLSHRLVPLIDTYASAVPTFAGLSSRAEVRRLLEELTTGYLHVRYGEAHVSFDDETWSVFSSVSDELLSALQMMPAIGG
jgi:hypothetical protein